jgi:competence/damage-inducible protein CinA-like protein
VRAEVVGIGTEILLGQIANTNAREISERLAEAGVDVLHHHVVGDNVERIADSLRLAMSRADVVVATGGLGPTGDDVTRDAVAAATGRALTRRPEIEEFLREKFRRMNREMPESNLVQADVPEGARYLLPQRGTAPGLVLEMGDGTRLYAVPGVPAEMREMLEGSILPELREATGPRTLFSRQVRVAGMPEARVGELLDDLFRSSENPTVAYLASAGEVRIRLTAAAPSRDEAQKLIRPVEEEVRVRLGDAVFGVDEESLEGIVADLLAERKLLLACAESLTGGSLGARITAIPKASTYFLGSAVCYSKESKRDLLGIPEEILDGAGTVSEECAIAMASAAGRVYRADLGLSTTGVAGPDSLEGKPPGTVFVALAGDGIEEVRGFRAPGDREQVRGWAEQAALDLLRRQLARRG